MSARAAEEEHWRARVAAVLKGAPFETLIVRSADEIAIGPLYAPAEAQTPRALRQNAGPWRVMTRIDHPDAGAARGQALVDLENGANGLAIVFANAASAHGFGLPPAAAAIAALLDGISLDVRLELEAGPDSSEIARALVDHLEGVAIDPTTTDIGFGLDPIGSHAGKGRADQLAFSAEAVGLAKELSARGFKLDLFAADGRCIHAAGGTEAQELAFALASGVAYLRLLEGAGVAVEHGRAMIGFRLAADADVFMTPSKYRALRRLWAQIEAGCGLGPRAVHIHAETAWRMMARRDPWVNVVRAGAAASSAGLGGADSCVVTPFTQAIGLPDAFARRLARNTQLVMLEEAHLGFVADPAAGAGGFEALTHSLCESAWALFQKIEASGGLAATLAVGWFQTDVVAARARRQRDVATRISPLTGVSEFPDIYEDEIAVLLDLPARADPAAGWLAPMRDAEAFEALRDESDRRAARGERPKIFLANLGPATAFTARANFAKGLFEAGGIAAPSNDGFGDVDSLVEAFRRSGASLACLCSSDAIYGEWAAAAAAGLRAAGARRLYIAGRPGAVQESLAASVDEFLFVGVDAPALLRNAFAICD